MTQWINQGITPMPRKPPRPPIDLVVQGLSGPSPQGQVVFEPDDFEPTKLVPTKVATLIPPKPMYAPHGLSKGIKDARIAKAKRKKEMAQAYLAQQQRAIELIKHGQVVSEPKLAYNQTKLGDNVTTVGKAPSWRRL